MFSKNILKNWLFSTVIWLWLIGGSEGLPRGLGGLNLTEPPRNPQPTPSEVLINHKRRVWKFDEFEGFEGFEEFECLKGLKSLNVWMTEEFESLNCSVFWNIRIACLLFLKISYVAFCRSRREDLEIKSFLQCTFRNRDKKRMLTDDGDMPAS